MTEFEPGAVLAGRFKVVRRLGAGGVGAVYEVEHQLTQHRRALKVLHPRFRGMPEVAQRFLREASAAGRIGNPHIVETFDAGELESGAPWLLMELLEGDPLSEVLRRNGRLEVGPACALMVEVALAIQAAHDAGIVHRDLKPDNLFVGEREGRPFVKVLDFGMSKFDAGMTGALQMTAEGTTLGTPLYMAPEQMRGARDVDGRADVYALGVVLYEAIAGGVPYNAQSFAELAVLVLGGACPRLEALRPETPPELAEIVHRAMAIDPAQRFEGARELAEALMPFARTPPSRGQWWKRTAGEAPLDQTAKRVTPLGPDATLQRTPSPMPLAPRQPLASPASVAAPPVAAARPRRSRKWMVIGAAILFAVTVSRLRKHRVGSIEDVAAAVFFDRGRTRTVEPVSEPPPPVSSRKCCRFTGSQLLQAARLGALHVRGPHVFGEPVELADRAAEFGLSGPEVEKIEKIYAQSTYRTHQQLVAMANTLDQGGADEKATNRSLFKELAREDDDAFERALHLLADERAELLPRLRSGREPVVLKMLELFVAEDERSLDELEQVLGPERTEQFVDKLGRGAVIEERTARPHALPH